MKSPRETLLDRHREISPELDAIRQRVIADELTRNDVSWVEALRHWLSFNRIAWASFATAWVAIIGLNLAANVDGGSTAPLSTQADAADVVKGVQRYQTQLASLLKGDEPAEPPEQIERSNPTGPRSDATHPRRHAPLHNQFYA